jgi:hypothetical protein
MYQRILSAFKKGPLKFIEKEANLQGKHFILKLAIQMPYLAL